MPTRLESITRQRLEKLERLRARGIDPYPARFHRTHTTEQAAALFSQQESSAAASPISVAGRIMTSRSMGKAAFFDLRDGWGKLQLYFRQDRLGAEKYQLVKELDLGDFVGVMGTLFRTKTGEITLEASDIVLLAKSLQPLPEKWHGLVDVEKRYRQRYLDLISNPEVKKTFVVRSRIIKAMRRFLDERGFIEVETPVLQPSPGGAAARPFVTHHLALDQKLYLRIATELHLKRLIIGGLEKVYEIGRIFRNEGISTKHNPEFTTLESYEAYADYHDVMAMVEQMFHYIVREVLVSSQVQLAGSTLDFTPPWQRLTLREAIKEASDIDFEEYPDADSLRAVMQDKGMPVDPSQGRGKLIDELLSTFVEPNMAQPVFLMDYPVELSPLAKKKPDNPRLVERFEGFAGGMEICNAFTELNDPLEQRERFVLQQKLREGGDELAETADEDFLLAMEYGMPPTGGLGVGIDRLVMVLTNQQSIREVIAFPQLKTKE